MKNKKIAFTLEEVISPHPTCQQKRAFTLAEVFSPHPTCQQKRAFTLAEVFSPHPTCQRKSAFTLAEVLITLVIIGVVAALTIPTLMANHRNKVTATKLKKFYSVMNQAIKLAEVENGDISEWYPEKTENNNKVFENWYLKYLDKHITSVYKKGDATNSTHYNVAFSDGSGFNAYSPSSAADVTDARAYIFYCLDFKNCKAESYDGKETFLFVLCKDGKFSASTCKLDAYNRNSLLAGCRNSNPHLRHVCTALIQYDGWKISDDYPWRK